MHIQHKTNKQRANKIRKRKDVKNYKDVKNDKDVRKLEGKTRWQRRWKSNAARNDRVADLPADLLVKIHCLGAIGELEY